jgi:hypothetical protein
LRDFDVRWKAKALPGHPLEDWPEPDAL